MEIDDVSRAIPDRRESLRDSKLLEKLLFLYIPEHFHNGNALDLEDMEIN